MGANVSLLLKQFLRENMGLKPDETILDKRVILTVLKASFAKASFTSYVGRMFGFLYLPVC